MTAIDWKIVSRWELQADSVRFAIPEPQVVRVVDEVYDGLPLYKFAGGWNDGTALRGVAATGCALRLALDPWSVRMRLPDGTLLDRGKDWDLRDDWGTIGRLENGRLSGTQQVLISYRYIAMRLDSVIRTADGGLRLATGTPAAFCPPLPDLAPGEERLLNIYTDAQTDKLTAEAIYPITETCYPEDRSAAGQQAFIPNTMRKLLSGEPLTILAWGDSVTQCDYMDKANRWQLQFVQRLQTRYPDARMKFLTNGYDGQTIKVFLAEPEGSPHNFQETVVKVMPDLVISEFVNDQGLPREDWEYCFNTVYEAFRSRGIEWIILTPHYVRPDWMGLTTQNGPAVENDPRPYVAFIREFTAAGKAALADAAKRYGRLWRQGIPYNTLMVNTINHPNRFGMGIFADALMSIFE